MTGPWLDVVGIGADGPGGLAPAARSLLREAALVVGGRRHLAMVETLARGELLPWASPLEASLDELLARRGRPSVVLASGDPLWFGIGRLLLRRFAADELRFHPHVSAFQLAAARLAWPLADVLCLSLHGRPLETLHRHLAHGRRLLVLTSDGAAPAAIGKLLTRAGFATSTLSVLGDLGGPAESQTTFRADAAEGRRFSDLNTLAITLDAGATPVRPLGQGLPDDAFVNDGQLTKQAVRAVTLATLGPRPGERLWDIGAGAGSIAIEWLLAGRSCPDLPLAAIAVEAVPERAARITLNARALGVPELQVIEGRAPDTLPDGPPPDAVFVGGGVAGPGVLEACLERLRPGGRLVANAVTLAGEARLLELHGRLGGELARLAVAHAAGLGRELGWRAKAPVTQWAYTKPGATSP